MADHAEPTRVSIKQPHWDGQPGSYADYLTDLEDYATAVNIAYVCFAGEAGDASAPPSFRQRAHSQPGLLSMLFNN